MRANPKNEVMEKDWVTFKCFLYSFSIRLNKFHFFLHKYAVLFELLFHELEISSISLTSLVFLPLGYFKNFIFHLRTVFT